MRARPTKLVVNKMYLYYWEWRTSCQITHVQRAYAMCSVITWRCCDGHVCWVNKYKYVVSWEQSIELHTGLGDSITVY